MTAIVSNHLYHDFTLAGNRRGNIVISDGNGNWGNMGLVGALIVQAPDRAQWSDRIQESVGLAFVVTKAGSCIDSTYHTNQFGRLTIRMTLQQTAEVGTGLNDAVQLVDAATGQSMELTGVLHWAWAGRHMYFWPANPDRGAALAQCNAIANGQTLTLEAVPDKGRPKADNLGLAFVHGSDVGQVGAAEGAFAGDAGWQHGIGPFSIFFQVHRIRFPSTFTILGNGSNLIRNRTQR
jgi:hypothetical protein